MNTMFLRPRACVGLLLLLGAGAAPAVPSATVPWIKVDQFGYQPAMQKVAVVVDPQAGFNAAEAFAPGTGSGQYQIRRWADDVVVHTGTLQPWKSGATHAQSGDRGWHYDFSALTAAGAYYIWDSARQVGSGRFEIGSAVYAPVLRHAVRMFYHQRLNHAKVAPYVDARWADAAAYERPGQDRSATSRWAKGQAATARDLSGGWMDAGDTNKYVTFAQSAVLQLLDAYRMSPAVFRDDFGIPESGNGLPDLLDELKWELDFLRRMQDASGTHGLFLKVGVDNYTDISPPSADARPRYYLPECTSATLAGAAMFGAAHVVYRGFASQAAGAADLLARAEAAWARAKLTTSGFTVFQTAWTTATSRPATPMSTRRASSSPRCWRPSRCMRPPARPSTAPMSRRTTPGCGPTTSGGGVRTGRRCRSRCCATPASRAWLPASRPTCAARSPGRAASSR